jgi:amino acid adenylation domain-containing protein
MLAEPPHALKPVSISEWMRLHYAMQQGGFISSLEKSGKGWHIQSDLSGAPMWNHSALASDSENISEFLVEAADFHARANKRPTIYLTAAHASTGHLDRAFLTAGYERFDQETWMVHPMGGLTAYESRLEFKEISSAEQFDDFTRIFNSAYQIRDQKHAAAIARHKSTDVRSIHHFLGCDKNRPVCTTTLAVQEGIGCIYNVGTDPALRKRGFGREMLHHVLEFAREAGLEHLFLQVESGTPAERLYTALGFQPLFRRIGYRAADWRPALSEQFSASAASTLSSVLGGQRPIPGEVDRIRETLAFPPNAAARFRFSTEKGKLHPASVLTAAWACLLWRYTAEEKVEFGLRLTGESPVYLLSMVVKPEETAGNWLTQADQVLQKLQPAGLASGRAPAVETLLQCKTTSWSLTQSTDSLCPLELTVDPESLNAIELSYSSQAFRKDSIRRIANHMICLIEGLLFNPAESLSRLEMLTFSERQQLLVDWNRVPDFAPELPLIPKAFELQVERTPDAMAAILAGGDGTSRSAQLTYRQLNRRANRLAHTLQSLGVRSGTYVGVCLNRSLDFLVALLGILKCGGVCVPLDPEYPQERLEFMVEDSQAAVIITDGGLSTRVKTHKAQILCLDLEAGKIAASNEKNIVAPIRSSDPAYLIYTSGSTGKPKGVVIRHRAIAIHCADVRQQYGLSAHDRVLQFSSFNFDASFEQILPPLLTGACLVVRDNNIWNTKQFAANLKEYQLTVADIPTAYWHQLAQEWAASPGDVPANALRLVIVGGEAMSAEKLRLWRTTPLAKVRLLNAYGPTECTITATTYDVPPLAGMDGEFKNVAIGRPRADRKVYILDAFGNPAPIGVPGELFIGGETLADGYLNRAQLTEQKFVSDPFSDNPDARLYRTGDLCRYLEDGNIEFLGRMDDQVKIRGFRIELGEIETVLSQHPDVRETVLMARENPSGEKRLVAYMTFRRQSPEVAVLRAYVRSRLPEYMVPSAFVVLERLPLMPSGKVDRRALPAPDEQPSPAAVLKGPSNSLELQVQLAFERVLRRVPIAVNDSFFELGGDSLQALELIVEIERATGRSLPLGALYQSSTIEGLAEELQKQDGISSASCLISLQTRGSKPPFILIHTTPGDILGYGNLVYHLGVDQPCYGFQSLGMVDPNQSHTSIEDMATYYLARLREFQPKGPYYLGGWCYGGVIAVEMARQLLEAGQTVGLLALFETVAMPPGVWNFRYFAHRLQCSMRMSAGEWADYCREKIKYLRDTKMANRMRFRDVQPTEAGMPASLQFKERLARLEHVYNTNLTALKRFRSSFYPGKVTLFNAEQRDPALIPDPEYGWVGLSDGIEIHTVPGGHDSMLGEPHVSVLAEKLQAALAKAHAQHETDSRFRSL